MSPRLTLSIQPCSIKIFTQVVMRLYQSLLLLLLAIFTVVSPEGLLLSIDSNFADYSNVTLTNQFQQILNFDLSFSTILMSFSAIAFLVVLSANNMSFVELLSFTFYTVCSLCAILSQHMVLAVIFCEFMAIGAFFIIAADCKNSGPAVRYACVHFTVGIVLTIGLALFSIQNNSTLNLLIIIGLLMNCACFPFSFWVVDAYPAASLHGSAYLSIFTTKISFLVMLFHTHNLWQNYAEMLAFLGSITAIYGTVFALLEKNIRRFLCYNIVGQMGILIMLGGLLSTSIHTISLLVIHVLFSLVYQSLLFLIANSIILQTNSTNFGVVMKCTSVEGVCAIIAILTMAGFPGTAGFISKSYISANIEMNNIDLRVYGKLFKILNLLIYLAVGLKFFYYLFLNNSKNKLEYSLRSIDKLPMIVLASVCIVAGNPYLFIYDKSSIFNSVYNVKNVWLQSKLLISATLLFFPMRRLFRPRVNFKTDIDWIFRALVPYIASLLDRLISRGRKILVNTLQSLTNLYTNSYFNHVNKFKEVLNYSSAGFVLTTSLFLMGVLLLLLCLNH